MNKQNVSTRQVTQLIFLKYKVISFNFFQNNLFGVSANA